jgi:hypothetical protein
MNAVASGLSIHKGVSTGFGSLVKHSCEELTNDGKELNQTLLRLTALDPAGYGRALHLTLPLRSLTRNPKTLLLQETSHNIQETHSTSLQHNEVTSLQTCYRKATHLCNRGYDNHDVYYCNSAKQST